MAEINVNLTDKECDLIALALDVLMSTKGMSPEDLKVLNELFCRFDTLSEPTAPKVRGIHLVYDRDSNVRPLFPK